MRQRILQHLARAAALPRDARRVTPAERAAQLERRKEGFARRSQD